MGQHVAVVGSSKLLGDWDPKKSLPLNTNEGLYPRWESKAALQLSSSEGIIEYKYLLLNPSKNQIVWEQGPNRKIDSASLFKLGSSLVSVEDSSFNQTHE